MRCDAMCDAMCIRPIDEHAVFRIINEQKNARFCLTKKKSESERTQKNSHFFCVLSDSENLEYEIVSKLCS